MKYLGVVLVLFFTLHSFGQSGFNVPQPEIINDPDFYVKNTSGKSDGKTIGIDGEKLEDHRIYIFDTGYFLERMDLSLKTNDSKRKAVYSDLKRLVKSPENTRMEALKNFQSKYKKDPAKMAQYVFFDLKYKIEQAKKKYDYALATLNYKEKLRVKDRIDLDKAPGDDGKKLRDSMKEAITEIAKLRAQVNAKFSSVLKRGAAIQLKEYTKPSFPTYVVKEEKTVFFAYRELKGSSLLGMEEYVNNKPVSKAKPLELSKGAVVYLQKTADVEINGKKTKVFYVLSEGGVKEVSTNYVLNQKMYGWVYPGHLEKKQ